MANIDINKDSLFSMAKRITKENNFFPKNLPQKTSQTHEKIYLSSIFSKKMNYSPKADSQNLSKQAAKKIKNKFLERNNIQINEENVLHLLSERRKLKLAASKNNRNDQTSPNCVNRIKKGRTIYLNLENNKKIFKNILSTTKDGQNISTHLHPPCAYPKPKKFRKIIKYKNLNNNRYITLNGLNRNPKEKELKNSYSDYFDKSLNKSLGKSLILLGQSNKLNMNMNMDSIIKNSKSFVKWIKNKNIEEINNGENNNNNNINNNININININGNINDNNNELLINENEDKLIRNKKIKNKFDQNNKYHSNYPTRIQISHLNLDNIESNKDLDDNLSYDLNNDDINAIQDTQDNKIIKKKKHKTFYLNNIAKYDEENNDDENIENNQEIHTKPNIDFKNNTFNINLNFISQTKDTFPNQRISSNNKVSKFKIINKNLSPPITRENQHQFNSRNSSNINHIKSIKLKNFFKNKNIINNKIEKSIRLTRKKSSKKNLRNNTFNNIEQPLKTAPYNIQEEEPINEIIDNKKDIIQLEDLLILEGKFCHLLDCLHYENPLPKMCVEWWNFYTYSSYFGKFPKLFSKITKRKYTISDYQIAHDSIIFELLSIIITYQILIESKINKSLIDNLMDLINEIHQNFLIECDFILSKVSNQSMSNLWIKKLKNIILSKKNWTVNNDHLILLQQRNIIIHEKIQFLINTCSNIFPNSENIDIESLDYFNNNIQKLRLTELNKYFNMQIIKQNSKLNKVFTYTMNNNNNYQRKNNPKKNQALLIPYLPKKINDQKYTLVLDLDETLISFRMGYNGKGVLKMRPGLFNFLKKVKKKYELIVFTAGTKEYADPILDIIEKKEKFFTKRLYRQHTVYKDNIYIKDLSKLGRDLSKVIIVDNMPQNFCLQKENGILISNYFGEDSGDNTLNELVNILMKIAEKNDRDVRNEIMKYKEEIFTKITTNLDN